MERVVGRIALRNARPRDLAGIARHACAAARIARAAAAIDAPLSSSARTPSSTSIAQLGRAARRAPSRPSPRRWCAKAASSRPASTRELDELRAIDANCGAFLVALEARERERTGIANLKVEYNRVHGFYIEVTNAHVAKIPDDYRRRQTLKNAERYITPELKTFEDKALSAQERALAREKWLFERLLDDAGARDPGAAASGGGTGARSTCWRTSPSAPTRCDSCVRRSSRSPASRSAAAGIRWSSGRSKHSSPTTCRWRTTAGC